MDSRTQWSIGFDLGHAEFALASVAASQKQEPSLLEVNGLRSQTTAIGYHPQNGVVVGAQALTSPGVTDLVIGFKKRPPDEKNYRSLVRNFVMTIYRHLVDTSQIDSDKSFIHFFVGCPSGWSDADIAAYRSLLTSAGIPNLKVIRESRAALINAKEAGLLGPQNDSHRTTVLIVDIGSSTTDLTFIVGTKDTVVGDLGYDLGASLLDKSILQGTLEHAQNRNVLAPILESSLLVTSQCEAACRDAKEIYFANLSAYEAAPEQKVNSAALEITDGVFFKPLISHRIMQDILNTPLKALNGRSWIDALDDILVNTRTNLGIVPDVVLLTGGASRMPLVLEAVNRVFPECVVRREAEPEYTVAKGLARWGSVDIRSQVFLEATEAFCDNELPPLINEHADLLAIEIARVLSPEIIRKAVQPAMRSWQEGNVGTIENLDQIIRDNLTDFLKSSQAEIIAAQAFVKWLGVLQPKIDARVRSIGGDFGITGGIRSLNIEAGVTMGELDRIKISDKPLPLEISNTFATLAAGAAAIVLHATFIGAIAIFVGFGYFRDWFNKWLKQNSIPKFIRGAVVTNKMIDDIANDSKLSREIQNSFKNALARDKDGKNEHLDQIVKRVVEALQQEVRTIADEARLLID